MADQTQQDKAGALAARFQERFGSVPAVAVAAPGRANLIGEHTDYNDGFVLPIAIDRHIYVLASPRPDRTVHLVSADYGGESTVFLDTIARDPAAPWSNYERGVADVLQRAGHVLTGADMLIGGDVPVESGLSSSAAVEVATVLAFQQMNNLQIAPVQRALLAQRAENEFVGMQCGIMDQFASCLCARNAALFLDCRTHETEQVPLRSDTLAIVLCNSRVPRRLVDSEYNERRRQCEESAALFALKKAGVTALRDVTPDEFAQWSDALPADARPRCRYVIEENARVLQAVAALRGDDFATFGALMNETHAGLRDFYNVSCRELDLLQEIAVATPGVLGSRMMGGGFGGCTISLVETSVVDDLTRRVLDRYPKETGIAPDVYVCQTADGAGPVSRN